MIETIAKPKSAKYPSKRVDADLDRRYRKTYSSSVAELMAEERLRFIEPVFGIGMKGQSGLSTRVWKRVEFQTLQSELGPSVGADTSISDKDRFHRLTNKAITGTITPAETEELQTVRTSVLEKFQPTLRRQSRSLDEISRKADNLYLKFEETYGKIRTTK